MENLMLRISNQSVLGLTSASLLVLACSGGSTTVGVIPGGGGTGPTTGGAGPAEGGSTVVGVAGSATVAGSSGGTVVGAGGSGGDSVSVGGTATGGSGNPVAGAGGAATGGAGGAGGAVAAGGSGGATGPINVLVFNYTTGYGHQSRETAIPVLQAAAAADTTEPKINFDIKYALTKVLPEATSDSSQNLKPDYSAFVEGGLDKYDVVYFLNTTGQPLDADGNAAVHQKALQDYMEKTHGGFVGTHSATDTYQGNSWPWYVDTLMGANFDNHSGPGNGSARYNDNTTHVILSAGTVPNPWARNEEWYTLKRDVRQYKPATAAFTVLLLAYGDQYPERPSAWVNNLPGGGRMFYTAFGHALSTFQEPAVQKFLFTGIRWAAHRL
jgi:type 1 glutamine amidotransferase